MVLSQFFIQIINKLNLKEKSMKKIFSVFLIVSGVAVGIACATDGNKTQRSIGMSDVEAIGSSEKGCVNRLGENNGNCTTDGNRYFCENPVWYWFNDCVKGVY